MIVANVPGVGELPLLDGHALPVFEDEATALLCATIAHRSRPAAVTSIVVDERREPQLMAWSAIVGRRRTLIDGVGGGAIAIDLARRLLAWLDRALEELERGGGLEQVVARTGAGELQGGSPAGPLGARPGSTQPVRCTGGYRRTAVRTQRQRARR